MGYTDDLRYVVEYLASERYGAREGSRLIADIADDEALFAAFRDLSNMREPVPVTEEFLVAQDRMLQSRMEATGITVASELARVPADPRLSLWCGDITALEADAIVNAANSQMLGCRLPGHYCIDNAIHTFAGVQLRLECARLMDEQGHPEPAGMAKVTPAYNLPATWVIHTVGPIANGQPDDVDRALLANCYESCLDAAREVGASSIAFCCISTGVFGFPRGEAARIAVRAVRGWLDAHPEPAMHVIFNVFGEADEELYHGLLF